MQIPKNNFEASLLKMLHEKCASTNPWLTTRDLVELKEFIRQINNENIECEMLMEGEQLKISFNKGAHKFSYDVKNNRGL